MINGRRLLLFLALKFNGEWEKIFQAIKEKQYFDNQIIEETLADFNGKFVTIIDEDYPEKFKHIYKPPFVIFYEGDFSLVTKKSLSVVGTRSCSEYSLKATAKIIKELQNKLVIVSGLARGIDSIAHRTIISENGETIAVLGSGIDICYPSSNSDIYKIIKENHLLISEYPPHTPLKKEYFPFRNRLIAALGDALLVGETTFQSGTYHTIRFSLELGKDIFCIPHGIFDGDSTNALIRDGAILVNSGDDILKDMKII